MSYKVIALDIDGTLTNSKKVITPKTMESLTNLQEQGGKVILASGRPTMGILPIAEKVQLEKYGGYILSFNGGCVIDVKDNLNVVYSKNFPLETLSKICDYIKDKSVSINTYKDDKIIVGNDINKYTEVESRITGMPMEFVDDFAKYVNFDINKCLIAGEPDNIIELEKVFKEMFDGILDVFRSEPFFLELVPLGINKAESMDILLKSIGLTKDECIACGDGFNDITMVKYAGLGVAMENANEKLKQVADYITLSNDNDGIADVINKFML